MKKLILAFGALGLVSMFIPFNGVMMISALKEAGMLHLVLMIAAFAIPVAVAVAAKSFQPVHAVAALAGFAIACVKLKVWELLPEIAGLTKVLPLFLMVIAAVAGAIVSIIAVAKPERG
ncbi:MAG: hypothetical protein H0T46_15175 [Deltaproteobacteria bacterium]|nr:hypothetical protein [Deltaproteobacteria bacterium]